MGNSSAVVVAVHTVSIAEINQALQCLIEGRSRVIANLRIFKPLCLDVGEGGGWALQYHLR